MHTSIPDVDDIHAWLERVFRTRQRVHVDIGRYAEAHVDPDPDKIRRFITDVDFYDRSDALIRLARGLGRGEEDGLPGLAEAIESAASGSLYARALRKAFLYVGAASDYRGRSLPDGELPARLDMGEPEY